MTSKQPSSFSELVPEFLILLGMAEKNCVVSAITVIVLFAFLKGLYNRYFHPLRKFPGPFWGSVTDFYKLFIISKMDAHTRGVEMHKKYGRYRDFQITLTAT